MDYQEYVDGLEREALRVEAEPWPPALEAVFKGGAIELWSDVAGEVLFIVADEADAARLGEPRGSVYRAAEARMICRIEDQTVVREVHDWKCKFTGVVREFGQGGNRVAGQ